MIGKGNARTGFHAGAMGEAFGDLVAIEYLNENGFVPTGDENRFAAGTYATGNKLRGIRNYAMNFPMSAPSRRRAISAGRPAELQRHRLRRHRPRGPRRRRDLDARSTSIAQRAERQVRRPLPGGRRGPAGAVRRTASCRRRSARATGAGSSSCSTRSCSCRRTDDVDARNAILAADRCGSAARTRGESGAAFARRGLGQRAASGTARTGVIRHRPAAGLRVAREGNVNATFDLRAQDAGRRAGRRAGLRRPLRGSRLPDRRHRPATTNSGSDVNLDDTASFVPGTYDFTVVAQGYGFHRFRPS